MNKADVIVYAGAAAWILYFGGSIASRETNVRNMPFGFHRESIYRARNRAREQLREIQGLYFTCVGTEGSDKCAKEAGMLAVCKKELEFRESRAEEVSRIDAMRERGPAFDALVECFKGATSKIDCTKELQAYAAVVETIEEKK